LDSLEGKHFDVVVIGAGMSGLAASIRLALFDKKVLLLERHNVLGGLNSFYSFGGRKHDVGLHALTNYAERGAKKSPLNKIFRQLRIPYEQWDLAPQNGSRVTFKDLSLRFSNDPSVLETDIAEHFPKQIDGFEKLCVRVEEEFAISHDKRGFELAKPMIAQYLSDPRLIDMLHLPIMGYGSSQEDDLDWTQYVNLFKSIYLEGFCRPYEGVRRILRNLREKYKALGGVRKMKCGVKEIIVKNDAANAIVLDNGETITADAVISSIGYPETMNLCSDGSENPQKDNIGQVSFAETQIVFKGQPKDFGWEDTIIFFNDSDKLRFRKPEGLIDPHCGVICFPNNYQYPEGQELEEGVLRISTLANFDGWDALSPDAYKAEKERWFELLKEKALEFLPKADIAKLDSLTVARDMFTPKTIKRYTGHEKGAVYGATHKNRPGTTPIKNLFICGTDHGFVGITGTMLSGITIANQHILT